MAVVFLRQHRHRTGRRAGGRGSRAQDSRGTNGRGWGKGTWRMGGTGTGISLGVYGRDTNESNEPPSEQTETV